MRGPRAGLVCAAAAVAAAACLAGGSQQVETMDRIAESYVKLALATGVHDENYVDAYYGPPAWKEEAKAQNLPIPELRRRAGELKAQAEAIPTPADELARMRRTFLIKQLASMEARLGMLSGEKMTFDEESRALYDAVAPRHGEDHFRSIIEQLERRLPAGSGPIFERYQAWRNEFIVPPEKLDPLFTASVKACRERTARRVGLPSGESFTIEYVTGKPWSAYNWYQGGLKSLIQLNTSLPIFADRALDLACHEGYPGHHVYNMMLEHHLVKGRGWIEFTVYPLFSPMSLIAEGSANYGIELAYPGGQRAAFEREVVFPMAGLDPARAAEYDEVQDLVRRLDHAGNEAARRYLDGEIGAEEAARWLRRYALMSPASADQRVRFFDTYRSYVINYNLGRDMVKDYVERRAGPAATEETRWQVFEELLASPRLPSDLQ